MAYYKINDELRKKIKEKRLKLNLTREELSTICGISASYINKIERVKDCNVDYDKLAKILDVLGIVKDLPTAKNKGDEIVKLMNFGEYEKAIKIAKMCGNTSWLSLIEILTTYNRASSSSKQIILNEQIPVAQELVTDESLLKMDRTDVTLYYLYIMSLLSNGFIDEAKKLLVPIENSCNSQKYIPRFRLTSSINVTNFYVAAKDFDKAEQSNQTTLDLIRKFKDNEFIQKYLIRKIIIKEKTGKDFSEDVKFLDNYIKLMDLTPENSYLTLLERIKKKDA
jgi:transcriptional regulator with XRE-family HTH domain